MNHDYCRDKMLKALCHYIVRVVTRNKHPPFCSVQLCAYAPHAAFLRPIHLHKETSDVNKKQWSKLAVAVEECLCWGIHSQLPESSRLPERRVTNPSSDSKRYRIELGSGERAKEAFEKWQESLQQYENNIELLHRSLNLLKSTAGTGKYLAFLFLFSNGGGSI